MTAQIIDAPLTWQAVAAIADGAQLSLARAALARIEYAKALVTVIIERRLRCYGINTGMGALSEVLVDESRQSALSHNIIMSHACGVGEPLSVRETRAIMASAVNNFAHGRSGVRTLVVERLVALLNADLIPVVPRGGSLRRAAATDAVYRGLRRGVSAYADDRPFAVDIAAAIDFIRHTTPP
jgi:histidine ammonia-lyase